MARKKDEWLADVKALDAEHKKLNLLGDISDEELGSMTISQLKVLLKDMKADLEAEADGGAAEPVAEDGKFASMCGSDFDPKKTGTCYKDCQSEFPEAFKACEENYKQTDLAPARQSKPRLGKTEWGHMRTKQGGLIDEWFLNNKEPATLEEISEFASGREPRVMHHMKHLVADLGIEILWNYRKIEEEGDDGKKVKRQVKQYWWKDKDKRRKGDPLEGKSAYPKK